ncbi:hypothetical protein BDV93DRAFT_515414 [Ceratobasidium sp. AG-I]|nr:hypothetical protein BDV93DRAFT_515414 [Ceratobasidium sp. AG-I]
MCIAGFRGGFMTGETYLLYFPQPDQQQDLEEYDRWFDLQLNCQHIAMCQILLLVKFLITVQVLKELGLFAFVELDRNVEEHDSSLGSDFIVSFDGMANKAHFDKDFHNGYCVWSDLHLGLDPTAFPGVLIFLWRGNHERQCTTTLELPHGYTMGLSSFMQIKEQLVDKVAKAAGIPIESAELNANFHPEIHDD